MVDAEVDRPRRMNREGRAAVNGNSGWRLAGSTATSITHPLLS